MDAALGERLASTFVEVLLAPGYDDEALAALTRKPNTRILIDRERRRANPGERDLRRAEAAGCKALCVTVDTPILGARHRESRTQFNLPADFKLPNLNLGPVSHRPVRSAIYSELLNPALTWKDIEWLCSVVKVPVVLKGVLNPEDAALAVNSGASAIIVSNHGARNLDTVPSTAEALPLVIDKLQGKLLLIVGEIPFPVSPVPGKSLFGGICSKENQYCAG